MDQDLVMTLTDFLLARIAEDEATAHAAIQPDRPGQRWRWFNPETDVPCRLDGEYEAVSLRTVEEFKVPHSVVGALPAFIIRDTESDSDNTGALRHIARWDPSRVLAECEAKRRIVSMGSEWLDEDSGGELLKLLALPYAYHPDYQQEWRP